MARKIKTDTFQCHCGSKIFNVQSFGCDGAQETWVNTSCQSCGTSYEMWDSVVKYDFYMTNQDVEEIIDVTVDSMRASFALEGIKISDSVHEQIKSFMKDNPDFTV